MPTEQVEVEHVTPFHACIDLDLRWVDAIMTGRGADLIHLQDRPSHIVFLLKSLRNVPARVLKNLFDYYRYKVELEPQAQAKEKITRAASSKRDKPDKSQQYDADEPVRLDRVYNLNSAMRLLARMTQPCSGNDYKDGRLVSSMDNVLSKLQTTEVTSFFR